MVPKPVQLLGIGQTPDRALNGSNNNGDEQHDCLPSAYSTVGSPIGSSQAQIEAVKTEPKGLGKKLKKGWERLKTGGKKDQDLTPNSTPEPQEPGQSSSNSIIQTGQGDQQTPSVDDPRSALPLHGGPETTLQAFYNTQQPVPETHQGLNVDSAILPFSIPGSYTLGGNLQPAPHQERYQPRFSDSRDFLNSQGELPGTPAQASSVMGRSRPWSRQTVAHELPGTGSQKPAPDMKTAAAVAAFNRHQHPAQNGNLYAASSHRVGTSSSAVTSGRVGTPTLPIQGVTAPPHMVPPPKERQVQPSSQPSVPVGDATPTWSPPNQQTQPKLNSPALEPSPGMTTAGVAGEDTLPGSQPTSSALPLSPPSSLPSSPSPPPLPPPPLSSSLSPTPPPSLLSSVQSASLPSSPPAPESSLTSVPPPPEPTTSATGAQDLPGSEQEHTSPSSFTSPAGAADAIESRIKAYLAKYGVALDPVQDALGNLTSWSEQEQDRFRRHIETIQAQNQEAQQQQLRSFEAERRDFQQRLTQADQAHQTAFNLAREHELANKQKDLKISELVSDLNASRKHAADADARRKTAEAEYQKLTSKLKHAEDYIQRLRQGNTGLALERDSKARESQERLSQIQDLNIKIARHKADHKRNLEAKSAEYERELDTEKRQREALAAQHRAELADQDQQWRSFVKKFQDEAAMRDHQHRAELEDRDHQLALRIEEHAAELRSREAEMASMEAHYKQRLLEVESSIQAEIERTQKENRATIAKQRQQIASYSKDPYVPIEDAYFVKAFQDLVQDVNQLASQVQLPPTIDFDPSLDPTSCVERNARRRNWIWVRFVRSICWRVLLGGFFSLPFGFGALGRQGEGCNELRRMYQATCAAQIASTDDNTGLAVSMIPNDKDINIYRTLYMERIRSAIRSSEAAATTNATNGNGVGGVSGDISSYAPLFRKNVDAVGRELYDTLSHIVNDQLNQSACYQHACTVANKVGVLALDMGTQRARVWLETCRYGEHISLGDGQWKAVAEETTTTMASLGAGTTVVDLMVHPCLSRVGDGRADLDKKKFVVKGEFVPLGGTLNGR